LSPPKNLVLRNEIFLSIAEAMAYHQTTVCISSATGCIIFRNDDIQHFVLVIYNFFEVDDIHAVGVMC